MARVSNKIPMTEKDLEYQVKDLAKIFHWKYYHTWRSIHSPAGFPDCVMVRPPRLIFAELKSEKGKLSDKQKEWLEALITTQEAYKNKLRGLLPIDMEIPSPFEVYLWRPEDFEEIAECLR